MDFQRAFCILSIELESVNSRFKFLREISYEKAILHISHKVALFHLFVLVSFFTRINLAITLFSLACVSRLQWLVFEL